MGRLPCLNHGPRNSRLGTGGMRSPERDEYDSGDRDGREDRYYRLLEDARSRRVRPVVKGREHGCRILVGMRDAACAAGKVDREAARFIPRRSPRDTKTIAE